MPRLTHSDCLSSDRRCGIVYGFRRCLILIAALGCVLGHTALRAEDESGQLAFPDDDPPPLRASASTEAQLTRPLSGMNQPGWGIDGQVGVIGLPTLGREDSIVPLELFPYVQSDNQILFGNIRGFFTTASEGGANIGLGYRVIEPNDFALFGVNAFYDVDGSLGKVFHQLSVGWEARTEMFGAFGNFYFPVGKTEQILNQTVFNERFEDTSILFDVRNWTGHAMSGLDLNLQMFLPGDFARDHQIQATAGWYTFSGSGVEDINGFQFQLQGEVVPNVTLLASYTNDQTFGSNIALGGMLRFGTRDRPNTTLQGQLRRFVNRNYNVIVSKKTEVETGIVATKADGTAYVVYHVDGIGSGTPDGTVTDPYATIAAAQAGNPDIIFVGQDVILNEEITLTDGQSLIGQGANVTFRDARYGNFRLNPVLTGPGSQPVIDGTGLGTDLVTLLGNNTRIAGFWLQNAEGHGIVADGIDNFQISQVKIENSQGDGIYIANTTGGSVSEVEIDGATNGITLVDIDGLLTLSNIQIKNVIDNGVNISGGAGEIRFTNDLVITEAGQSAFFVTGLETDGLIMVNNLEILNTTGGDGIHLEANDGIIAFGNIDIEIDGAEAIFADDNENIQVFNGNLTTTNTTAVDIKDSGININLTSVDIDGGGTNPGMKFDNTSGTFAVAGSGSLGSGGEIRNTTEAVLMSDGPFVGFQTVDFTSNNKVAEVNGGDGLVIVGARISQTEEIFIDANNLLMLQVSQSEFTNNNITSGTGIRFQADVDGVYMASITYNEVEALPGTFFQAESLLGEGRLGVSFQVNEVELSGLNAVAADVNWKGTVIGYFLENEITGINNGQTGIRFHTQVTNDQSQVLISQNTIVLYGLNSIGVEVDVSSESTVFVTSNNIGLNANNGTGVLMNLRAASGANVSGNTIVGTVGGADGILFDNVEHDSTLVVNANTLTLGGILNRGIVLSNVLNADAVASPLVRFISTSSNAVTGASPPYNLPMTGVTGTLIINGVSVF